MANRAGVMLDVGLAGLLVTACVAGSTGSPSGAGPVPSSLRNGAMTLSIANGTTIAVTLVVNGTVVETVAPGGYQDPVPPTEMPPLPWQVEARSPSGRLLSSLTVHQGDVWQQSTPSGGTLLHGDAVRADLSCGRLDIWSGPPLGGPMFMPGPSGDCS